MSNKTRSHNIKRNNDVYCRLTIQKLLLVFWYCQKAFNWNISLKVRIHSGYAQVSVNSVIDKSESALAFAFGTCEVFQTRWNISLNEVVFLRHRLIKHFIVILIITPNKLTKPIYMVPQKIFLNLVIITMQRPENSSSTNLNVAIYVYLSIPKLIMWHRISIHSERYTHTLDHTHIHSQR